tara:strand:+ start:1245 stop:1496 length:252 start_codon:yes stop_codon:yes gene_type:complete
MLVTGQPELLLNNGRFIMPPLRRSRVTENEVRAAARAAGVADMATIDAIVLETDGSFSVIQSKSKPENSSLVGVKGFSPTRSG